MGLSRERGDTKWVSTAKTELELPPGAAGSDPTTIHQSRPKTPGVHLQHSLSEGKENVLSKRLKNKKKSAKKAK